MKFRLKELRCESGLKRSEFAEKIGMHANTVANYENETRQASYKTLIDFADYFGVSVDYLMGRDDSERPPEATGLVRDEKKGRHIILSQNERELVLNFRALSQKTKNRVVEYIGLWLTNESKKTDAADYPELPYPNR